jgi:hypothetical protein
LKKKRKKVEKKVKAVEHSEQHHYMKPLDSSGLPYGWQPIETAPYNEYVLVSGGPAQNVTQTEVVIARREYERQNDPSSRDWRIQFNSGSYMYPKYWQPLPKVPGESDPYGHVKKLEEELKQLDIEVFRLKERLAYLTNSMVQRSG